ncbi:MAG: ATP-binding protein [Deltaproteobacteria bacterium]|nr:ATP-binding protein [Deltaproteobacteria bacterium]
MPEIFSPARIEHLKRLIQFVAGHAETAGFAIHRIKEIELAAEEVLVNIFNYAYPDMAGDVSITCRAENGRLILEFSDTGVPFNILDVPAPDVTADIHNRRVGGLGVFLVKEMSDEAWYRREGDRNILRLIFHKHLQGAEGQERTGEVQKIERRVVQHGRDRIRTG